MGFIKNLNLILLLIFTSALLTPSTPVPNSPLEPSPSDISELALINQKSFQVTLPVYKLSEDGLTTELLNETTSGRLVCETSNGSPYIWDIYIAASMLNNEEWCQQRNPGGSRCTLYSRYSTAALSICGTWLIGVRCHKLAWVGGMIADHCRWGGKAGGQYYYDEGPGPLKGIVHWNNV